MKKMLVAVAVSSVLFITGVSHAAASACTYIPYESYLIPIPTISISALTAMLTKQGFTPAAIQLIINAIPKCALKP